MGAKLGAGVKLDVGIPMLAEGGASVNIEGSYAYTNSKTEIESQEITIECPMVVPP